MMLFWKKVLMSKLALACVLAGCVSGNPTVPIFGGAEEVRVLRASKDALRDCALIGPIFAEDGMTGFGKWHFDGTQDRLLLKIRNLAVRMGANSVWLDDKLSTVSYTTEGAKGSVVGAGGLAYYCD